MPDRQRALGRRSLLTLIGGAAASPLAALAEERKPPRMGRWFIQVWFEGNFPIELDPAANPGRLEVSIGGEFVACALAGVAQSKQGQMWLAPLSIGASALGRREEIKVEVFGELRRLARPVIKITEIEGKA
jgi:hypothetical protein